MTPLPYGDPGAKIAFYVLIGIFVVAEQRIRLRSLVRGEGSATERTLLVVIACLAGGVAVAFVLAGGETWAAIGFARWPLFIIGLVLMAAGIALRGWAIVVLGRFFTVDVRVTADQTVVDTGPYRWVRHPSYTGLLAVCAGIGLGLGNWLSLLAALVLPAVGVIVRIRHEERALIDGLGEPYRRFAASRARLIPGLW
ncbi:MAG: isoprenylcysteine carboxylmethyltransferase family protein [Solirubrobacterales bacterium]|nr:isoprenylcysteine carboxylmethyltransferase family protein [Solirubrobacterales bacterium]